MRLLPLLMILLTIGMMLSVYDVSTQSSLLISGSLAESKPEGKPATEKAPAEKAADAPAESKKEEPAAASEGEGGEGGEGHAAAKPADKDKQPYSTTRPEIIPPRTVTDAPLDSNSTLMQKDLLQSLSKRRDELDAQEKAMALRETILKATEMRIDGKIAEMRDLKKQVEDLLAEYKKKDEEQIMSLVKIYENMKPKDAARIFEEIDMKVLLQVINHMNERKIAPILANMSPDRAKDLTVEIAKQRQLPSPDDIENSSDDKSANKSGTPAVLPPPPAKQDH